MIILPNSTHNDVLLFGIIVRVSNMHVLDRICFPEVIRYLDFFLSAVNLDNYYFHTLYLLAKNDNTFWENEPSIEE